MDSTKHRVWIELDRAPDDITDGTVRKAFMERQCELANAMLAKLADMGDRQFFVSHQDTPRYCFGGNMGYKELADRGEWFNLEYLAGDNHHDALEAPRLGPPEKIGYGEQTSKAFDEGWNAAMNAVWERQNSLRNALGFTERTGDEGRSDSAVQSGYLPQLGL